MKKNVFSLILGLASLTGKAQVAPSAKVAPEENIYQELITNGVSFPVTYTGEVLGNPLGGFHQGAIYDGLLEAGIQADLGKLANWPGATFTADAYYPHGTSLTREDVHDLNVVSNIDAIHDPRLYELWLEQDLFDGKLLIRAGQIPADTDFFLSTYASIFVNSAFGALPTLALNMNAPIYPAAAPGVRVEYKPDDHWAFLGAVFTGNTGDPQGADLYGTNFNFDPRNGTLCLAETDFTVNPQSGGSTPAPSVRPLSATYKVGGFLNTADFADIKTGGTVHGDYGVYALADQELWHKPGAPDEGLRGFSRLGFAPGDRNRVSFEFGTGFNYLGLLPHRDKDLAGLGFVYTKVSDGVQDNAGTAPARHYESIIELTYQAAVNDHLSLQPDIQYVFTPGGGAEPLANALVLGLRFNMTF